MTVKRRFINGKNGQLHLRVAGSLVSRPALICLHMVPKSGRIFHNLLPHLGKDRLAIAPDFPGYGESDYPLHTREVSIGDYAESVVEVIEHFKLEQVGLIGYHTGSMVAVEVAIRRPDLVTKIINISAPIFTPEEVTDYHKYFVPIPLDEKGERFRIMWERIMHYRGPEMTLEMAAMSMAENLRGGERYEDGHRAAFNHTQAYAESLKNIEPPVFVMNIKDDLYEHTKRAEFYLSNGFRKDYPEFGNGFLDASPAAVAQIMLDFFDSGY